MADLIRRENALSELESVGITKNMRGYRKVASIHSLDAVEVVRCEKCKHAVWDEENEMWKCVESAEYDEELGEWFGFYEYHNGDFFCADGERKDGDGNG